MAALKEGGVSSNTIIEDFGSGLFAWESRMIGVQSPESRGVHCLLVLSPAVSVTGSIYYRQYLLPAVSLLAPSES